MGGNTLGFEYPAFLVDEERNKLYDDNLDLVVGVVSKYTGRGVSLSELFRAGREGLAEAANKYSFTDETEYEFKHFAMYYIRKHVQRAMGR